MNKRDLHINKRDLRIHKRDLRIHKRDLCINTKETSIGKNVPIEVSSTSSHLDGQRSEKYSETYGVATVSRIDTIIGLFCRIASLL